MCCNYDPLLNLAILKTAVFEMKRISLLPLLVVLVSGIWLIFIIEAWVYYSSSSSDVKTIFMDATTHGGNDLVLDMNASGIGVRADKSGASLGYEGAWAASGLSLRNGWHHIVWSMTPQQSIIYVDGILRAVRDNSGSNVGYLQPHNCCVELCGGWCEAWG